MSRSPKYSTYEIAPEIATELAERARRERERLAAEARKREKERRQALAVALQAEAKRLGGVVQVELVDQRGRAHAAYLSASTIADVEHALTMAGQLPSNAGLVEVQRAVEQLKSARRKLERAGHKAAAALRDHLRREEEKRIAEKRERDHAEYLRRGAQLRELEGRMAVHDRIRFDEAGLRRVGAARQQAYSAFERGDIEPALKGIVAALEYEKVHFDTASAAAESHARQYSRCQSTFSALTEEINSLRGDEALSPLIPSELEELFRLHRDIRERFQKEDFGATIELCEVLAATLERVRTLALERAAQNDHHAVVSAAVTIGLKEMGYRVTDDGLERPLEFTSDRLLRVDIAHGAEIGIRIQSDGGIVYRPRGFSSVTDAPADSETTECRNVTEILDELRERVRPKGVEIGEVTWDGKRPDGAVRKRAKKRKLAGQGKVRNFSR